MNIQHYKQFYYCFLERNFTYNKKNYNSMNFAFNRGDSNAKVEYNRKILSNIFGGKHIIFVNQIHSNNIYLFGGKQTKIVNADGIISKSSDSILAILTADCAPIILIGKKFYGIIHAGWRGLVLDIIKKGVGLMTKYGEKLDEIKIIVGPHLGGNSFEVQKDFISNLKKFSDNEDFLINKNNKTFFNFSKMIKYKINKLKIKDYEISNIDTFENPKKFFSHRYYSQNGLQNCGRQISLVGINNMYKANNENCIRK